MRVQAFFSYLLCTINIFLNSITCFLGYFFLNQKQNSNLYTPSYLGKFTTVFSRLYPFNCRYQWTQWKNIWVDLYKVKLFSFCIFYSSIAFSFLPFFFEWEQLWKSLLKKRKAIPVQVKMSSECLDGMHWYTKWTHANVLCYSNFL